MQHAKICAAILLALVPVAAIAQSAPPPPAPTAVAPSPELKEARGKMRAACAADVQKFYGTIERGKGR